MVRCVTIIAIGACLLSAALAVASPDATRSVVAISTSVPMTCDKDGNILIQLVQTIVERAPDKQPASNTATPDDQLAARQAEAHMQINIARKAANRIPLTRNAALDKSAKSHAKYVASVGDLNAGGDPDGSLKERIEKWIKNPLVMFEFSANWASSVTEMTNAIMDHQKHRDIVLSDSNLIGIGVVDNFWTFQIVKDALKEDQ